MKNRQGINTINSVLTAAIILVIAGSGFAAYRILNKSESSNNNANIATVNQTNSNTNTSSITNTTQVVNSNVSLNTNATANTNTTSNTNTATNLTPGWKTYTNDTYGFRFNYPPTHSVSIEGATFIISANDGSYPNPTLEVSSKSRDEVITDSIETEGSVQNPIMAGTVAGTKIVENASTGGDVLNYLFVYKTKTFLLRGTNTTQNQEIFSTFTFTN